jgi:hypothetical protein
MNSYLCLSVTGGGILGVGPAHYISRLETDLGFPLHKKLVGQAGTSTGSIIAAAMAEGLKGSDIEELYKKNGSKIFTKYSAIKRLNAKCPTYDNSNLKRILKEKFKGKLKDWNEPIFITTTFMNGPSVEKVWDPKDDVEKWFAVLTSCSAPTYFDVIVDDNKRSFCDGGMWANSCPDVLMAGMFRRGYRDIRILNLETGMDAPNTDCGNKTLVGWGKYIITNWAARASRAPGYVVASVLGDENFFNVLPKIDKPLDMDKVSVIDKVISIWDKKYNEDRDKVLKFVNP